MITLLSKQIEPYKKFIAAGYIYLKAGVGWGKSFFTMKAIQDSDKPTVIIAPSHLLKQWDKYLSDEGIPHTVNSFGKFTNVSIWSVQKITRMFKTDKKFLKEFRINTKPALLVIDEYHRILGAKSNIYRSLQTIPASKYIFLSATPIERGIQDLYPALRINAVLDIKNNPDWGLTWRSWTAFKQYHCIMGGFENRQIMSVFQPAKMKMLLQITFAEYEGNEDKLAILSTIMVNTPEANAYIKKYRQEEETHFATIRTVLNGFRYRYRYQDIIPDILSKETFEHYSNYIDSIQKPEELKEDSPAHIMLEKATHLIKYHHIALEKATPREIYLHELASINSEEKYTVTLFRSGKVDELAKLIEKQQGKALLFYEFTAETEMLRGMNIKFYHKTRYTKDDFENDPDTKVMAVHYKSLGEGVRFKFVDTIYLFTISISNRSKNQAIGRAVYAGREKLIKVYEFTTNTTEEKKIVKKLNQKESEVELLFKMKE